MIDLADPYVLSVISFVTSFITVVFGIGGGTVMLVALTAALPAHQVIVVHGLVQLGSNFFRASLFTGTINWKPLRIFFVFSIIGVVLGGMISLQMPVDWIKLGVAIFILFSLVIKVGEISPRAWAFWGGISSFLTMFVGATGPLIAALVQSTENRKDYIIGTQAAMLVIQHGLKVALLLVAAPYVGIDYQLVLYVVAAGIGGTMIGKRVGKRIADDKFKMIFKGILAVLACMLLWQSVQQL